MSVPLPTLGNTARAVVVAPILHEPSIPVGETVALIAVDRLIACIDVARFTEPVFCSTDCLDFILN